MTVKFHIRHWCHPNIKQDHKIRERAFKLYPTLDLGDQDVILDITIFELFEETLLASWVMNYFDNPKMGAPQYLNRYAMKEFIAYWESLYEDDLDDDQTRALREVRDLQLSQEVKFRTSNWLEPYITLYAD